MTAEPSYEAYLEEFRFGRVSGWARNRDDAGEAVRLEILVNGSVVSHAVADDFRADLASADFRYGFAGYCAPIRLGSPPSFPASIEVRVASTGSAVTNGRITITSPYEGYVDSTEGGRIEGWALNIFDPDARPTLAVFADGERVGSLRADKLRWDLLKAGIGTGHYGFQFAFTRPRGIPQRELRMRIEVEGSGFVLPGSDASVLLHGVSLPGLGHQAGSDRGGAFAIAFGALDPLRPDSIAGWALDLSNPNAPCRVAVEVDGLELSMIECDQLRPDLVPPFGGHGRYGFLYRNPEDFYDGQGHLIRFFHGTTYHELQGSPVHLHPDLLEKLLLDSALARLSG